MEQKEQKWLKEFDMGGDFVDYEGDLRPNGVEKLISFISQNFVHKETLMERVEGLKPILWSNDPVIYKTNIEKHNLIEALLRLITNL